MILNPYVTVFVVIFKVSECMMWAWSYVTLLSGEFRLINAVGIRVAKPQILEPQISEDSFTLVAICYEIYSQKCNLFCD